MSKNMTFGRFWDVITRLDFKDRHETSRNKKCKIVILSYRFRFLGQLLCCQRSAPWDMKTSHAPFGSKTTFNKQSLYIYAYIK